MDDDTENLSTPALDEINAGLAFIDFAVGLHDLATNAADYKARLKKLRRLERSIAAAEQKLSRLQTEVAGIVEVAQAQAAAIHEAAAVREKATATLEDELAQREARIARRESAWRYFREPEEVSSGFKSPEFSPLQKARMAHGQPPGKDPDIYGLSEPDAASTMRIDALSDTSNDPHADRQGTPFLGELSRDVSHRARR